NNGAAKADQDSAETRRANEDGSERAATPASEAFRNRRRLIIGAHLLGSGRFVEMKSPIERGFDVPARGSFRLNIINHYVANRQAQRLTGRCLLQHRVIAFD